MTEYDFSGYDACRVANEEVDMLVIANELVWEKPSTVDGPYYLNDATGFVPGSFSDGTPNIVTGHLFIFKMAGFVTGLRLYDGNAAAGSWIIGLREVDTVNGHTPISGAAFLQQKTVSATGGGLREIEFDDPVEVDPNTMYLATRYSSTGYYVHRTTGWSTGGHGAFTDADPVYLPGENENVSSIVTGWASADRSLYMIGAGNVVPTTTPIGGPYYGISPIFYKSL